jgi:steroid C-25 hydroxylase gamma subunit
MRAKKVRATKETLLEPAASVWAGAEQVHLAMMPTPLAMQPSTYVQASWKGQPYGVLRSVKAASLHNREEIFFRLEWEDPSKNDAMTDSTFADGAALLFPMGSDAPILQMGDTQHPVNAWHWRADLNGPGRNNVAHGLGTTRLTEKSAIICRASWDRGAWRVVFGRPLVVPDQIDEAVQFKPGQEVLFGVAIWQGQNRERAGIKAFSQMWRRMTIEA